MSSARKESRRASGLTGKSSQTKEVVNQFFQGFVAKHPQLIDALDNKTWDSKSAALKWFTTLHISGGLPAVLEKLKVVGRDPRVMEVAGVATWAAMAEKTEPWPGFYQKFLEAGGLQQFVRALDKFFNHMSIQWALSGALMTLALKVPEYEEQIRVAVVDRISAALKVHPTITFQGEFQDLLKWFHAPSAESPATPTLKRTSTLQESLKTPLADPTTMRSPNQLSQTYSPPPSRTNTEHTTHQSPPSYLKPNSQEQVHMAPSGKKQPKTNMVLVFFLALLAIFYVGNTMLTALISVKENVPMWQPVSDEPSMSGKSGAIPRATEESHRQQASKLFQKTLAEQGKTQVNGFPRTKSNFRVSSSGSIFGRVGEFLDAIIHFVLSFLLRKDVLYLLLGVGGVYGARQTFGIKKQSIPPQWAPTGTFDQANQQPGVWHVANTGRNQLRFYYDDSPMEYKRSEPGQYLLSESVGKGLGFTSLN
ncbi:hypothetical protein CYMTET_44803 [Cymbomonas tetramitiformis]|uniref:Uncharacterized protein n=1 Tax=Cymbomonas tetramitiformis TaxID=36881 RepID=A0AAE0C0Q8_9CHLO|nr:hypothetical protein CYMTET_44803 [Cymbomonas tetramitiformis]